VQHPVFWRRAGNLWLCRTMFGEIQLPMDWPVYVSHAEATAYAKWLGRNCPRRSNSIARRTRRRTPRWSEIIRGATKRRICDTGILILRIGIRAGGIVSARCERARRPRSGRQRMGMDAHGVQTISRFYGDAVLSRILSEFLRWKALRYEGRFTPHGSLHAAAVVPQLVPAALSVRLRNVSLRRGLIQHKAQALGAIQC